MSKHAFQCFFGLWRSTNNPRGSSIPLPLPKTARIVPFNVAAWNVLKGGSDTITKLIEICQEKVGIRTENNIATARILLYFGVTFHRLYHIFSADMEPDDYGTIYHWSNVASHRSTFAESLELFHDTLLGLAKGNLRITIPSIKMPNPTGLYEPSPGPAAAAKSQSSANKKTPVLQKLPPGRTSLGATPANGQSIDWVSREFNDQCDKCNGIYLTKRMAASPEEVEVSANNSSDDESLDEDRKAKDPRQRNLCYICKVRTPWACLGCGRSLCLSAPKKRTCKRD